MGCKHEPPRVGGLWCLCFGNILADALAREKLCSHVHGSHTQRTPLPLYLFLQFKNSTHQQLIFQLFNSHMGDRRTSRYHPPRHPPTDQHGESTLAFRDTRHFVLLSTHIFPRFADAPTLKNKRSPPIVTGSLFV